MMSGVLFLSRRLGAGLLIACLLAIAPAQAATLRGTVYGATGILGLQAGGLRYDLSFHNARSGSWYDTFRTVQVTPAITAIGSAAQARTVLEALQDFVRPLGPIRLNDGQSFLVMAFASADGDISFLTTGVGSVYQSRIYGSFQADAVDDAFYRTVSFVTARESPATLSAARRSFSSAAPAMSPIPVPGSAFALLGALGLGALVLRRRLR